MEALADTLRKENKLLENDLANLEHLRTEEKVSSGNSDRTYDERLEKSRSRVSFAKERATPSGCKGKENMMREISILANGFSSRKQYDERGKSRVIPDRDSNALFSIKNGINRPGQTFF